MVVNNVYILSPNHNSMKKLLVTGALVLSLLFPSYTISNAKPETKQKSQLESVIIKDGMYDNHNAFVDESKYSLEKILESVEMIGCTVGYSIDYTDENGKAVSKTEEVNVLGSGIVVEKKAGKAYLLTNCHITDVEFPYKLPETAKIRETYRKVYIIKDGLFFRETIDAEKVASDKNLDVALLEVKDSKDFKKFPYKIGNSDELSPGDFVWIAGNPHGLEDYVLKGNVSKKNYPSNHNWFMIGCDVQPGYSGGAVIAIRDGKYELVGVVVATLIRPGTEKDPMADALGGYGIAIKINPAMKVLNDYLINKDNSNKN